MTTVDLLNRKICPICKSYKYSTMNKLKIHLNKFHWGDKKLEGIEYSDKLEKWDYKNKLIDELKLYDELVQNNDKDKINKINKIFQFYSKIPNNNILFEYNLEDKDEIDEEYMNDAYPFCGGFYDGDEYIIPGFRN